MLPVRIICLFVSFFLFFLSIYGAYISEFSCTCTLYINKCVCHTYIMYDTCTLYTSMKNIFKKMYRDVGMAVPKTTETRCRDGSVQGRHVIQRLHN